MKEGQNKTKLGVVTFPIGKSGYQSVSNLVEIYYSILKDVNLITGNAEYDYFKNDKRIHVYGTSLFRIN